MTAEKRPSRVSPKIARPLAAAGLFLSTILTGVYSAAHEQVLASSDSRGCSAWPNEILPIFAYYHIPNGSIYPEPGGYCNIYDPNSGFSYPAYWMNAVVLGRSTINGGSSWIIAADLNETNKNELHWIAKLQGFQDIGDWPRTDQGQDFMNVTGWRIEEGQVIPPATFEPGWGVPINPWEDASMVMDYWMDENFVDLIARNPGDTLQRFPVRYAWAQRWLPRGTLTPTATASRAPTTINYTVTATRTPTPSETRTLTPTATTTATSTLAIIRPNRIQMLQEIENRRCFIRKIDCVPAVSPT